MPEHLTSADGTSIAFERTGRGPAVVLVSGILCDRRTLEPLAEHLSRRCTALRYDRRGRGDSTDAPRYAVEREVEDLAALIAEAGDGAAVYGHSSGAGLALRAAAAGVPIRRLVLHEPPYGPDDDESTQAARALAERVDAAVAGGRRAEAIELFMSDSGLPPEVVAEMARDPRRLDLVPTMPYDHAVMDELAGGTIPEDLVRAIEVPTLVVAGGASPEFFLETAARIVELLPDGRLAVLEGQDHGAPGDVVAPVVADFLTEPDDGAR